MKWARLADSSWAQHQDTNLRAPVMLAQAFAKQLPPDAKGNIINIVDQRVWKLNPQVLFLHDVEGGVMDSNPHTGTGAGTAHPRQCHRAGASTSVGAHGPVGGSTSRRA